MSPEHTFVFHSNNYYYDYCRIINFMCNITQSCTIKIVTSFFEKNEMMIKFNCYVCGNGLLDLSDFSEQNIGIKSPRTGLMINFLNSCKKLDILFSRNEWFSQNDIFEMFRIVISAAHVDLVNHINNNFIGFCILSNLENNIPYEMLRSIYDDLFLISGIPKNFWQMDIKNSVDDSNDDDASRI